eukprot:scaffold54539_cov28-Tisochrysis_lutea.AAC.1
MTSRWLGWLTAACVGPPSLPPVKEAFIGAYNKKFPEAPLTSEGTELQVPDDSPFTHTNVRTLKSSDIPSKVFVDKGEVRVVFKKDKGRGSGNRSGQPCCKNYGCQREFDPASNHDAACRHHAAPPMFHDTRKWWTCCEDRKVYSFDELMEIPGCVISTHSVEPPAQEVERAAALAEATKRVHAAHLEGAKKFYDAPKPDSDGKAPAPKQDFKSSTPPGPQPKKRPPLPEGRARCKHPGCQAEYTIAENHETACRHHTKPPLFHEGSKQWPCCGIKKWDFDDFLAVPGCNIGPHEPEE